jgi:pre-mRNA-processing factor SLU7
LDAARKAGNAPAELDEEGNEINPHIPQYIAQAPWYLNTGHPGLKHQRYKGKTEDNSIDKWYHRGQVAKPAATKYRKGACENCGAMTHKAKDCVERPRVKGARWTGKHIQVSINICLFIYLFVYIFL